MLRTLGIRTWCPTCGAVMPADGPEGLLVHVLSQHPTSDLAHKVVAELALPQLTRPRPLKRRTR